MPFSQTHTHAHVHVHAHPMLPFYPLVPPQSVRRRSRNNYLQKYIPQNHTHQLAVGCRSRMKTLPISPSSTDSDKLSETNSILAAEKGECRIVTAALSHGSEMMPRQGET